MAAVLTGRNTRSRRQVARSKSTSRPSRAVTPINHDLQQKLDVLDLQYMAVQTAPTLAERRKRAPAFFRLVAQVEAAMYADAKRNGEDPFVAALRVNEHSRLNVLTLRNVLSWNSDETWAEFMKADPRTRDDDEAA